jgi:hypothetical protein
MIQQQHHLKLSLVLLAAWWSLQPTQKRLMGVLSGAP